MVKRHLIKEKVRRRTLIRNISKINPSSNVARKATPGLIAR
jgi:hypothetical protein